MCTPFIMPIGMMLRVTHCEFCCLAEKEEKSAQLVLGLAEVVAFCSLLHCSIPAPVSMGVTPDRSS